MPEGLPPELSKKSFGPARPRVQPVPEHLRYTAMGHQTSAEQDYQIGQLRTPKNEIGDHSRSAVKAALATKHYDPTSAVDQGLRAMLDNESQTPEEK